MMINTSKRVWGKYESTFHLAWINKNYARLSWKGKLVARIWKAFYWFNNITFSLLMFLPELGIILLINSMEGVE